MSQKVWELISDRALSEWELRDGIDRLEGVTEAPSTWVTIANDPTYSPSRRAICICQLFKRHFRQPIQLSELAGLLQNPDWINPAAVLAVQHLKGELPVEWNLGETVLAVNLFPGEIEDAPVLYLRLSEPVEVDAFVKFVKDLRPEGAVAGMWLLEAACG